MGTVRSCPQCGNRKCVPNRDKLETKDVTALEGLPAPLLRKKLHDAMTVTEGTALDLAEGHLDLSSIHALRRVLDNLAYQAVVAQACMLSSIFALESNHVVMPGSSPLLSSVPSMNHPAAPVYLSLRGDAAECLRKIGVIFESVAPAFQDIAFPASHPSRAWSSRPVDVGKEAAPATGKGYLNSFQEDKLLEQTGRQQAYAKRLEAFLASGGDYKEIREIRPVNKTAASEKIAESEKVPELIPRPGRGFSGGLTSLGIASSGFGGSNDEVWLSFEAGQWYDYVVSLDHTIRCYPNSATGRQNRPRCGHSLLARPVSEISTFKDEPIVMAGDLCILKNSHGAAEIIILTNNSGHFKPSASDLPNAVAAFEKVGVPRNKIYLFSGPNSIVALRRDLSLAEGTSIEVLMQVVTGQDMLSPYTMVSQWEKQR